MDYDWRTPQEKARDRYTGNPYLDYLNTFGSGISAGWIDELRGGVGAGLKYLQDPSSRSWERTKKNYRAIKKDAEKQQKEFEKAHPESALATEVLGGLTTIPLGLLGAGKLTALPNTARHALGGGAWGGLAGGGYAPEGETLKGVGYGVPLGGILGGGMYRGGKFLADESHRIPEVTQSFLPAHLRLTPELYAIPPDLARKRAALPKTIVDKTLENKGYTVNLLSGEVPTSGLMVGKYANTDPRNLVITDEAFSQPHVRKFIESNLSASPKAFRSPDDYLGTWQDTSGTYLDVAKRFPEKNIRGATIFGEKTGQLAGYNIGAGKEFPIGNWSDFINSKEFADRVNKMQDVGADYLGGRPWWDMHGTSLERVYGSNEDDLRRLAGYIASTAPTRTPQQNTLVASEYMRRNIKGEPIIQPDWRVPSSAVFRKEGTQIGNEATARKNLEKSARGDIESLQHEKVRGEAAALMGDKDVAVLDRWWSRGAEKPELGIFTATSEGKFRDPTKNYNQYYELESVLRDLSKKKGLPLSEFSANAWTGMRETAKKGELFGVPTAKGSVVGESFGYDWHLDNLVKDKAKHLGISVKEAEKRLGKGDMELLGLIISTPVGMEVFNAYNENNTFL